MFDLLLRNRQLAVNNQRFVLEGSEPMRFPPSLVSVTNNSVKVSPDSMDCSIAKLIIFKSYI